MGEEYASQNRSEFDWYNPHLYNYLHDAKKTDDYNLNRILFRVRLLIVTFMNEIRNVVTENHRFDIQDEPFLVTAIWKF